MTKQPQSKTVPVVEEQLVIGKREVQSARLYLSLPVRSRDVWVREARVFHTAQIERKPIGKFVDEAPEIRKEGDVLIIPVLEEVIVVEKRLRLVEEIHVTRLAREEQVERSVTLRKHEVKVRREPSTDPEKE